MKIKIKKRTKISSKKSNNCKTTTDKSLATNLSGDMQHTPETNIDIFIKDFAKKHTATSSNIKLIEKYLEFQNEDNCIEDIVRASALNVLCSKYYWGLTEKYLEYIKQIIEKNDWKYSETQIVSFSILGEYLYDSPCIAIFEFLISLLNNELQQFANNRDVELRNRIESIYECLFVALNGQLARIDLISSKIRIPEDPIVLINNLKNKINGMKNLT